MKSLLWPLIRNTISFPRRVAVVDDQREYTYAELVGGAMALAEKIDSTTSAAHVGILLPTGGAFPVALLGVWLAGRVAVPFNYLLSPDEIAYVIGDSDVDTIITVGAMMSALGGKGEAGEGQTGQNGGRIIPEGVRTMALDDVDLSGAPPLRWPPMSRADEVAVVLYTSGTSGRPKGVMLTHGNLRSNVDAGIQHAGITGADTFLGVLPQFHSFGLTAMTLLPLRVGAKAVFTARFVPRRVVGLIQKHRPDVFVAVPSMYGALLSVKNAGPEDFASIRIAVSGGEPLPRAVADQYRERFGVRLLEGYGLTETSPLANWATPERYRPRSVGTNIPGVHEVVVDDHDRVLGVGQEGEILISGPNIMKGYYKLPKQTAGVFVDLPDGQDGKRRYFRTGDIGHLDGDGYLFITGRKKEMLIIGGENVFPREIEEVLNTHPSVRDSAVIGRADDIRGEVPIAFIEVEDPQGFDATEVRNWCREQLAQFKVPREINVVQSLPRNPTGKIMRRKLSAD